MIYRVEITVTYKKSILEPQGQAILLSLKENNIQIVSSVRLGKHVDLNIEATSKEEALQHATKVAQQFLCNSIMENYHISILE